MKRSRKPAAVLPALLLTTALAGCAGGGGTGSNGTLTVFAAASLKSSFTEIAERFEAENPGITVTFSFAGSADLATQLSQGAPADVFASADAGTMAKVQEAGLVHGEPRDFATNTLAITVPPGNPAGIRSFADLGRPGTRLVACAPQVPCGAAAARVADSTGTVLSPVSEENSVTDVLGKVISGEADAGLVYVTDVRSAGTRVEGIPFPEASAAVNPYPAAVLAGSRNEAAAGRFLDLLAGPEGQEVLAADGFGPGPV
ncbi:molybdate ABC transporter substrate-binding protein [Arthrobacter sp. OY3WO11]|uniref:molybdate ABC transporter substrate-binding protein n=1 Tax=Arthrobacter sp. OY3WO11 TaxID=1835723 RepID=UPI0007D00811|nr:molybdate ABC transporter substrate-binding protein [Arthrobacter sp. OY3WO11]OAE03195.1 molybdate-binding protein [Arthrobacter sp. OY3WO11]